MLSLHDALPVVRQSVPSAEAVRAFDDTDVETGIKPDAAHARRLIQGDEAPDLLLLRAIVDPLPRFSCVVTAIEPVTQHPDSSEERRVGTAAATPRRARGPPPT